MKAALTVLAMLLLPALASACAVCGANDQANQDAFMGSTIFLSLLPLGAIGILLFLAKKRLGADWRAEFDDSDAGAKPNELSRTRTHP